MLLYIIFAGIVKSSTQFAAENFMVYNRATQRRLVRSMKQIRESNVLTLELRVSIPIGLQFGRPFKIQHVTTAGDCTRIPSFAFADCSMLQSAELRNVIDIGEDAFHGCTGLISIRLSDELKVIRSDTFNGCVALSGVLTLPDSVTRIEENAFRGCTSLTGIVFSDNVTYVGSFAFEGCTSLTSVVFGSGVTDVLDWTFSGCRSLQTVVLPSLLASIGFSAFNKCSSLHRIEIPSSVTVIGDWAFSRCSTLRSIKVPGNVQNVGGWTFLGCESLVHVSIPDSVKNIGTSAFNGCVLLPGLDLPSNLSGIGELSFLGCESLTSMVIPDSVRSVGRCAFFGCRALVSVVFPSNLVEIQDKCFLQCSSLAGVISLPSTVASIGEFAFGLCSSVTGIELPAQIEEIPDGCFTECSSLVSVKCAGQLKKVGEKAFNMCSSLVDFPFSFQMDSIGREAFYRCFLLKVSVAFGEGTRLSSTSFQQSGITEFAWAAKSWPDYLLYECKDLKKIDFSTATEIGRMCFARSGITTLTVPAGVVLGLGVARECLALASVKIACDIPRYAFSQCVNLASLVIYPGPKTIGRAACQQCNIKSLDVPTTVSTIETFAFEENPMRELELSEGLRAIQNDAFFDCNPKTVVIPSTVVSKGNNFGQVFTDPDTNELVKSTVYVDWNSALRSSRCLPGCQALRFQPMAGFVVNAWGCSASCASLANCRVQDIDFAFRLERYWWCHKFHANNKRRINARQRNFVKTFLLVGARVRLHHRPRPNGPTSIECIPHGQTIPLPLIFNDICHFVLRFVQWRDMLASTEPDANVH